MGLSDEAVDADAAAPSEGMHPVEVEVEAADLARAVALPFANPGSLRLTVL